MLKTCPVCQSKKLRKFHDKIRGGKAMDVIACPACNTMHLDKEFNQEMLNRYYVDAYRREFTSELNAGDSAEKFFRDKLPLAVKRVRLSLPYLKKGKDAAYLEIGCGPGYFLNELKKYSSRLYGLELSLDHARYAKTLGLTIYTDPLENVEFDAKFDAIFLFHVLEHIAEPVRYLKRLKSLLNKGGKIIIEVPGIADPLVQLYRIPGFRDFYFQEPHLYYFSEKSFRVMGDKIGMTPKFHSYNQYGIINHLTWAITGKSNVTKRAEGNAVNIEFEKPDSGKKFFDELNKHYLKLLKKFGFDDTLFVVLSADKV